MKNRKGSISRKVFSVLILLGVLFIVIVAMNIAALEQIEINNNTITTFMQLEVQICIYLLIPLEYFFWYIHF